MSVPLCQLAPQVPRADEFLSHVKAITQQFVDQLGVLYVRTCHGPVYARVCIVMYVLNCIASVVGVFYMWSACMCVCLSVSVCVGSKSSNEDVPAIETSIPSHLDHMLHLLCEEDSEADGGMVRSVCVVGEGWRLLQAACFLLP